MQARKGITAPWTDLLPVAVRVNLETALKLPRITDLLPSHEVAINLDQNVLVMDQLLNQLCAASICERC